MDYRIYTYDSDKASKIADFNSVHYYGNLGFFTPKKKKLGFFKPNLQKNDAIGKSEYSKSKIILISSNLA